MTERVKNKLERRHMLRWGGRIGVAVSGGADSVFLLHVLAKLGVAAAVLHVNHKLRGAQSDRDEEFVRWLAEASRLPFSVEFAPPGHGNLEQEARRQRYRFFERVTTQGLVHAVATGHTRDDQAETVLYRFLRGSGTSGLSGIRPVTSKRIIRPLLDLSGEEVRRYLQENGIRWQEDCSNADVGFARNRIRLAILPMLRSKVNPSISETLAGTAEWARAEEEYWDAELRALVQTLVHWEQAAGRPVAGILDCAAAKKLPLAVVRRLLRRIFEEVRGDLRSIDMAHVEAVRELISDRIGSGRVQVPGLDAIRSFELLRIARLGYDNAKGRDFEAPMAVPGTAEISSRDIRVSLERAEERSVYNSWVNAFDWEKCAGTLILRNWRPGDQFQCQSRSHPEKIKALFQEFRIPLWERRAWPVITVFARNRGEGSGTVVWTRRFGISAPFAAHSGTEHPVLVFDRGPGVSPPEVTESKLRLPTSIEVKRAPGFVARSSGEAGAEVL